MSSTPELKHNRYQPSILHSLCHLKLLEAGACTPFTYFIQYALYPPKKIQNPVQYFILLPVIWKWVKARQRRVHQDRQRLLCVTCITCTTCTPARVWRLRAARGILMAGPRWQVSGLFIMPALARTDTVSYKLQTINITLYNIHISSLKGR